MCLTIFFLVFTETWTPEEYCKKLHGGGGDGSEASTSGAQQDDINLNLIL